MLEYYKRMTVAYNIPNDDLCNLHKIQLIPLNDFLKELGMDQEDFSRTDNVLQTTYTLCNVETQEVALKHSKVIRNSWRNKKIFFLGTKLYFPQKVPKEYPPDNIYPYLRWDSRKFPYFEPSFHYKLYGHQQLQRYSSTPWHVAVY